MVAWVGWLPRRQGRRGAAPTHALQPLPASAAPPRCALAPLQYERRDQYDRIVIETTGLAQPAPIIQVCVCEGDLCRAGESEAAAAR